MIFVTIKKLQFTSFPKNNFRLTTFRLATFLPYGVGGRVDNLAKVPYLVLFVILISISVGTASALITITLAGDVHITGDTTLDGTLSVGTDDGADDDFIFFDDGSEFLLWDESATQFRFTNAVVTPGVIQAGNNGPDLAYNRLGFGTANSGAVTANNDLFIQGNIETDGDLYADGNIFVGTDDGADDDFIYFDTGENQFLQWDDSQDRFEFSNELAVLGPIITGTLSTKLPYNSMGIFPASAAAIDGVNDLNISDSLEVGHDIYLGFEEGDSDIRFFDGGVSNGERFQWDDSADAFEVSDDFTVFGKLTAIGGVDPPYVSFSAETHDSIKQLSQNLNEHEEVMLFWNIDNHQFEVYEKSQDAFYTMDGKEVKYISTGIHENSALNRIAEFEEEERIRMANPEVEEHETEEREPETEE